MSKVQIVNHIKVEVPCVRYAPIGEQESAVSVTVIGEAWSEEETTLRIQCPNTEFHNHHLRLPQARALRDALVIALKAVDGETAP